ncbi:MAG: hypothetical protein ACK4IB_00865 [Erythrobacter sp.]
MKVNTERLLDLILVARPHATPDDVRKLAPLLAPLPDADLAARIAKAQRRKERTTGNLRMKMK